MECNETRGKVLRSHLVAVENLNAAMKFSEGGAEKMKPVCNRM